VVIQHPFKPPHNHRMNPTWLIFTLDTQHAQNTEMPPLSEPGPTRHSRASACASEQRNSDFSVGWGER
jgi:hypothetical protein